MAIWKYSAWCLGSGHVTGGITAVSSHWQATIASCATDGGFAPVSTTSRRILRELGLRGPVGSPPGSGRTDLSQSKCHMIPRPKVRCFRTCGAVRPAGGEQRHPHPHPHPPRRAQRSVEVTKISRTLVGDTEYKLDLAISRVAKPDPAHRTAPVSGTDSPLSINGHECRSKGRCRHAELP